MSSSHIECPFCNEISEPKDIPFYCRCGAIATRPTGYGLLWIKGEIKKDYTVTFNK